MGEWSDEWSGEWQVAALYKFVALEDYRQLREPVLDLCRQQDVCGTLLLAAEGINGTIAGPPAGLQTVLDRLQADPRLADLDIKYSVAAQQPFRRMKVKLKREIVTLGIPGIDPVSQAGEYVDAADWNALLDDPEVLLIDTRNDYEVALGSFKGAVDPGTGHFRQFPAWVEAHLDAGRQRKVAMFCTGGIRCEKASSYLRQQGFEQVYHLKGGILQYLEQVPPEQSRWRGACFVFDDRVAVDHHLQPTDHSLCYGCGRPLSAADRRHPDYEPGVSCHHCSAGQSDDQRRRFRERERQRQLAAHHGPESD